MFRYLFSHIGLYLFPFTGFTL
ncbi:hypothetical protein EYZ11_003290 [Aspergillus tanneri]|uniref:Uncharacterized protein n=1 Tax=Aspergillus tanneri TaxID=1220188 RepID=A0A4S3JQT9_9EURO|nr:hypothetical protein EYZ11_003290 [Aspergillus tanneri]